MPAATGGRTAAWACRIIGCRPPATHSRDAAGGQTILRIVPPGAQPPYIARYNASSGPILQLSLSSEKLT